MLLALQRRQDAYRRYCELKKAERLARTGGTDGSSGAAAAQDGIDSEGGAADGGASDLKARRSAFSARSLTSFKQMSADEGYARYLGRVVSLDGGLGLGRREVWDQNRGHQR